MPLRRAFLSLLICLSAGAASAQGFSTQPAGLPTAAPPPPAEVPASWTRDDYVRLYAYYSMSFDGCSYAAIVQRFHTKEAAQDARYGPASRQNQRKVRWETRLDAPKELRPLLTGLESGEVSEPVRVSGGTTDEMLSGSWIVLRAVRIEGQSRYQPDRAFLLRAAGWVQRGLVPSPSELAADPQFLRAEAWFDQVDDQTAAERVPAIVARLRAQPRTQDLDPLNFRYPSGFTPLVHALLRKEYVLAAELLAQGANPNYCGTLFCPLSVPKLPLEAARMLVSKGARADQHDSSAAPTRSTPLTEALLAGDLERAAFLLEHDARPEGVGLGDFPLGAAASTGSKEWVTRLMALGATPVPRRIPGQPGALLLGYVDEDKQPEFAQWLVQTARAWAEKQPAYVWRGWVEQGKQRHAIDGGTVRLKPGPFTLVLVPPLHSGVHAGFSLDPKWLAEIRAEASGNLMFSYGGLSARTPKDPELLAYQARPADAEGDAIWGGAISFPGGPGDTAEDRAELDEHYDGRRELPEGGVAYFKRFDRYVEVREGKAAEDLGKATDPQPLAGLKGRNLYLAVGVPLVIGHRMPLIRPGYLTIEFR